jgi:hypothetical protein
MTMSSTYAAALRPSYECSCITKYTKRNDEECLDLVFFLEGNLMIPGIAVEKT